MSEHTAGAVDTSLLLVTPESTPAFARREAGGKGWNLFRLSRRGLPVPDWRVLGRRAFEAFLGEEVVEAEVAAALAACEAGEATAEETAAAVAGLFAVTPLPEAVQRQVEEAFGALGGGPLAVRSSAADEDGALHSFAGQLASFLYVPDAAGAAEAVKRCWASGFSARVLAYRRQRGLRLDGTRVAVVLQRMVDPEVAGVLFTCDPVAGRLDRFLVSAVYGVGEGLVSGALAADELRLDAATGALLEAEIADKQQAFRRQPGGGCRAEPVPPEKRQQPCLEAGDLARLHALGVQLMADFGRPQDVEWALAGGRLHLLQTRPVTTLTEDLSGYPNLWDNSNIIESYGGLTSPLSFTFALRNYHSVYVQFCEVLRVPPAVIRDMDPYLRNMLGSINGRVYYNLYNWYKLVGVLPGFRHNRRFMETMMGVSEELSEEIRERVRPHPSWDTPRGRWRRLRAGLAFAVYHLRIQVIVDRFLAFFHPRYEHYRRLDFEAMRSDELFAVYLELDRVFLRNWKAPIINDFLCMVHFGLLRRLTESWLGDLGPHLQNDLLAGQGNLESAEPTRELMRLAAEAGGDQELKRLIESTPAPDLMEALARSPHREFHARVEAYVERFGFRCMDEMKLEAVDLVTDPAYLFTCLKNYLRAGTTDLAAYEERERTLRREAEAKVRHHLRGPRRWLYGWSLRHARKAVRNRENTRFARTRIYGVARKLFQAMGEDLVARGVLERPDDVWSLTLEEIYGAHQGTLPVYDLATFAALRRREVERYRDLPPPRPRFQTRGPVYWHNRFLAEPPRPAAGAGKGDGADLKGLPCCPGVVEGIVKVVAEARADLELDGEILVAPRTDPGWVPLYPSIRGLLVERGSLLSHSAIVAREMGLPTIVGIPGLTATLASGQRVRMDGTAGTVEILEGPPG